MRRLLRAAPGAGRGGAAAEQRCAVKGELASPSPRTAPSLRRDLLMTPRPSLVAGISSAARRLQLSRHDLPGAPPLQRSRWYRLWTLRLAEWRRRMTVFHGWTFHVMDQTSLTLPPPHRELSLEVQRRRPPLGPTALVLLLAPSLLLVNLSSSRLVPAPVPVPLLNALLPQRPRKAREVKARVARR